MIVGRKYWLKKVRNSAPERLPFHGWEKAKVIAILIASEDERRLDEVKEVLKRWEHEGKHIHIYRFSTERMSKKRESLRIHNTLYKNETNWKGIPNSADFNGFINREYDVVLHLCKMEGGIYDFLPHMVQTAVYVGPQDAEHSHFDLQLKLGNRKWNELLEEMEEWLNKIRNVA